MSEEIESIGLADIHELLECYFYSADKTRERIATACLAGLLASPCTFESKGKNAETPEQLSLLAIDLADQLIAQLDQPKE